MYKKYKTSIIHPLGLTFIMWVLFAIQFYTSTDFGLLGIYPRTIAGLLGIVTGPIVHGNLHHIVSNTIPLLFLGTTLFVFYNRIALWIFFSCYLMTGLLVWILARPFYHIGASGLVYGIAFFLFFFGLFRKDFRSLIISIIVTALYGGIIYGVLPSEPNVSWESHAFGALIGIGLAFSYRDTRKLD